MTLHEHLVDLMQLKNLAVFKASKHSSFRSQTSTTEAYLKVSVRSYLEGRTYTVHINDAGSTPIRPPAGLPQGAVLSITLFTLYIADIPQPLDTQLALYTDDIAILSQTWRPDTITRRLNSALSQLLRYFNK
jgi:uncharacterized lipoprotein YbaY